MHQKRNVYLIALDGYARWDVIRRSTGIDLDPLFDRIGEGGFRVARNATANYPTTFLSLSSTLQMGYVALPESVPPTSTQPFLRIIQGRSETVRLFKSLGYHYIHSGSGWAGAACGRAADVCITSERGRLWQLSELPSALIAMTPLRLISRKFRSQLNEFGGLFELVDALETHTLPEPFLLFAHVLSPHPPFSRLADCSVRPTGGDLDEWISTKAYAEKIHCTNRNIEELVALLGRKDPDAIVVLFSDHGSAFTAPFGSAFGKWTDAMLQERLPTLIAAKFPEQCNSWFRDDMTNVNIVRFVLGCLQNKAPDYLPDRRFFANYKAVRVMEVSRGRLIVGD